MYIRYSASSNCLSSKGLEDRRPKSEEAINLAFGRGSFGFGIYWYHCGYPYNFNPTSVHITYF